RRVPFVPAVQAFGIAIRGKVTGATTWAELRSKLQPRPNSKLSRCAFARPQVSSCLRAQSAASLYCGEPLRRGPWTSVSCAAVSITWDLRKPSSRMRPIVAQSRFSVADAGAAASTASRMEAGRLVIGGLPDCESSFSFGREIIPRPPFEPVDLDGARGGSAAILLQSPLRLARQAAV